MISSKKQFLRVGIIGCGLIGKKRAAALDAMSVLVAASDTEISRAKDLFYGREGYVTNDWQKIVRSQDVDVVIVSTRHDSLAEITEAALCAGKHVLVEKPGAKNAAQIKRLIELSKSKNLKVHIGFNHRYHRSIRKAKSLSDQGVIGDLMFIRARYGHGGRIGYENEWRADPAISGGGELIDQGSHLIDLTRYFLGEVSVVWGEARTFYWRMPVDDNCFMFLENDKHKVSFLHVSCTEWKNMFSMEIYGNKGKLELNGLGGSYGVERLTWYENPEELGPPNTTSWEYPKQDNSWELEIKEFFDDIRFDRIPNSSLNDALANLEIIEKIYERSGYDFSS